MKDFNDNLEKSIRDLESIMGNRVGPGNGVANIFGNIFGGGYTFPYTQPTSDPTFTSGLNYARSIAGGQNVPNMIAPGVSYSAERPQGYTQFADNPPVTGPITDPTPSPVTGPPPPFGPPVTPPPPVNLPGPPMGSPFPIDLTGIDFDGFLPFPIPGMDDLGPINFGYKEPEIDYDKLYDTVISNMDIPDFSTFATKDDLNKGIGGIDIPTIDTSQFVTKDDIPTFNPYDFRDDFLSIAQEGIEVPTFDDTELRDLINKNTTSINSIPVYDDSQLRDDINSRFETYTPDLSNFATKDDLYRGIDGIDIPTYEAPDLSGFVTKDDLPTFNPYDFRDDFLSIAQEGIDIPTYEAPDLSNFVTVDDFNAGIGGVKMTGREELERAMGNISSYDDTAIINLINQNKESIDSIPGSINMPDLSGYATIDDLNRSIGDIPTQSTYDDRALRDRLDMLENQYTTGFDELNNMFTPIDTSQFLTAGDIPTYNAPDLSGYATLNDLNSFKDSISNTPINIGGPVDLPGMGGPSMDPIPPMSVGGVGGGSVLDSTNYVVPQVPLNNLSNQNPPQGPVGMTPQETAKVSSQQELLNLMSNKDVLSQIPADDGVRNQYQVELDEYINKSPINMDTYKEELPVGSAINLGIPAVMETVVPMVVPGMGLAKNISNSLSSNNNPSPAPRPSSPSVSRPNYSHSQVSKFGR